MEFKSIHIDYMVNDDEKSSIFVSSGENEDITVIYENLLEDGNRQAKVKIVPKKTIKICALYLETDEEVVKEKKVFLNGYQTWTESREFSTNERIPKLSKIGWNIMNVYGDYWFYKPSCERLQSFTYTYIREGNKINLIGSLCEAHGYTIFEYEKDKLKIIKDCKGLKIESEYEAFNIFQCTGSENAAFSKYFNKMEIKKPKVLPCTGWTSWYNYYTHISEDIILSNLNSFVKKEIPIDIFQIDDGYERAVGDWLIVNDRFPRGMKFLSREIKKAGFKSGIWLAPFICEKKSMLYKKHPDWAVKSAGYNPGWSGRFVVLDFYNEEVRQYLKKVFETIFNDWDFDMVKLDFLYAAALLEREDKTRGTIMYEAMTFLRNLAGKKIILGCGVPLGASFGLVDYCRIGSDVSLTWEDKILNRLHYRERVSTINSITSTIGRRQLNGKAFFNDPDVFILRSNNNRLTKEQRYTLFLINTALGGLVFTSDNIDKYSDEELKIYKSQFVLKDRVIEKVEKEEDYIKIYFSSGNNKYMIISNLSRNHMDFQLSKGIYFDERKKTIEDLNKVSLNDYESVLLRICKIR